MSEPRPVPENSGPLLPELFDGLADILADALVASYLRAHALDPVISPSQVDNAYRQAYKVVL